MLAAALGLLLDRACGGEVPAREAAPFQHLLDFAMREVEPQARREAVHGALGCFIQVLALAPSLVRARLPPLCRKLVDVVGLCKDPLVLEAAATLLPHVARHLGDHFPDEAMYTRCATVGPRPGYPPPC